MRTLIDSADLDVAKRALDFLHEVPGLTFKARTSGGEYKAPCPRCGGTDRFVCWPYHPDGARAWCRQCHPETMDPIAFLMWRDNLSFGDAVERLRQGLPGGHTGKPPKVRATTKPTLVDTTEFEDAHGVPQLRKERWEPGFPDRDGRPSDKSFVIYHPDPAVPGGWARGGPVGRVRALFDLRRLLEAPPGSVVYLCEGELKAKRLAAAGWLATTTWEGGTAWDDRYAGAFLDQHVVILEDHDATGAARTARMLPSLLAQAQSVRVVRFPELPAGADVLDWLNAGGTIAGLAARAAATPPEIAATPPATPAAGSPAAIVAPYQLYTAAELAALPPPTWLIDGLFETGKLAGLYGFYGAGKSFLCLDWALSIATGQPWQGHAVQAGPVVYVCPEGASGLAKRIAAWQVTNQVEAIPDTFRALPATVDLLDPASPAKLLETLVAYSLTPASLIVIDTLARAMPGAEEDNAHFSIVVDLAGQVQRATGAAVLAVHHSGKDNSAGWRGGTSFPAGADTIIGFKNDDGVISLTCEKQKDHEYFKPTRWMLVEVPLGEDAAGKPITSCVLGPASDRPESGEELSGRMRAVLDALISPAMGGEGSARDLQEATGLGQSGVFWALNKLMVRGYVAGAKRKGAAARRFRPLAAGYAALEQVAPWLQIPGLPPTLPDSSGARAPILSDSLSLSADPFSSAIPPQEESQAEILTDSHRFSRDSHAILSPSAQIPPTLTPPIEGGERESGEERDAGGKTPWEAAAAGVVPAPPRRFWGVPPPGSVTPPHEPCPVCLEWHWAWLKTGGWATLCQMPPGTPPPPGEEDRAPPG